MNDQDTIYKPGNPYGSGHRVRQGPAKNGQVEILVKRRVGWPYPDDGTHPRDSFFDATPFEVIHREVVPVGQVRGRLQSLREEYCRVPVGTEKVVFTKDRSGGPIEHRPTLQDHKAEAPSQGDLFG